ncbi:MAG: ABC transporter permease [Dehalococcoidia bacterium]|nr:ABC transporter permease [Dehalococcoidia bacterium]
MIIAGREIKRLRARFGGKMIATVAVLLAAAAGVSFLIYLQGMVLAGDFYNIGVSPGAPGMDDQRFHIINVDSGSAGIALQSGEIDAYLSGRTIFYRQDNRSQYAAGAVRTYLRTGELQRVAAQYPLNQAFPLRVEVNYLKAPSKALGSASVVTLSDIMGGVSNTSIPDGKSGVMQLDLIGKEKGASLPPGQAVFAESNASVMQKLERLGGIRSLPEFKAEFATDKEVIVPSLMNPPIPLAQVLLAFLYVLPIFFISIFFTSGFIEEKMGRKINILLSTPITPLQVIIGKMLPYIGYSLMVVLAITLVLRGNPLLATAIFLPVILFIFAIYLGVALQYRTFKDQTFFSLVAVTGITGYLVFPAMFVGINDLSYVSPLTLAVQMYRGAEITVMQYMLSAIPMLLVFVLALVVSTRIFNEEYLLNFQPIYVKVRQAIYFAIDKRHIAISVAFFSLLLIPVVFMMEMGVITLAFNLPKALALSLVIFLCVVIEEMTKSLTVAVAIDRGLAKKWQQVVLLAVVSAAFFSLGEKLLLFMSLKVISESVFTAAVFASNALWIPLLVHSVCTLVVCLMSFRLGMRGYPVALLAGSLMHGLYNMFLIGAFK